MRISIKWTDLYKTEAEIVEDLKRIRIPKSNRNLVYNGYEFIHSFARQVQNGKSLSDKQMVQAKRLAEEIKRAVEMG